MIKKILKIVFKIYLIFLVLLFIFIIVYDRLQEFEEYYRIDTISVEFFNPIGKEGKCVLLEKINTIDTTGITLVGLKYKVETFSEHINWLHVFIGPPIPEGGLGHIDKITEFTLQLNDSKGNQTTLKDKFKSAKAYKYFKIKGIKTINKHSMSRGCYMANVYESLDEFINAYNNDVDYNVSDFNEYYFFILDHTKLSSAPIDVDTVKVHLEKVPNELPPIKYGERFKIFY